MNDDLEFRANEMCCACSGGVVKIVGCANKSNGTRGGSECDWYNRREEWCGAWDDDDFNSFDSCCGCGGGIPYDEDEDAI